MGSIEAARRAGKIAARVAQEDKDGREQNDRIVILDSKKLVGNDMASPQCNGNPDEGASADW